MTAFFNLSLEDQGTAVLQHKNSINQLLEQNQKMTELVTSVNLEREHMGSQIMAVMAENQRLLEVLKHQPNSEEITAKIQERCQEDYDKKLTELVKLNQLEIMDQKEQHQKEMAECDKYYDNLLTTLLNDIKEKYERKLQKELKSSLEKFTEEQRTQQAQIASLSDQLDKLRRIKPIPAPRERTSLVSSQSISLGDKLNALKKGIFDYVPGTININRGGAMDNTTINWMDQSVHRHVPKHVTFVTSTPLKPQAEDRMDNEILAVPLPQEVSTRQRQMVPGEEQSTINIIANEFRKLNPPKLQKLKGGTSPSAQLFLFSWVKVVKAVIKDRDLTDSESIQQVREFTEGKA